MVLQIYANLFFKIWPAMQGQSDFRFDKSQIYNLFLYGSYRKCQSFYQMHAYDKWCIQICSWVFFLNKVQKWVPLRAMKTFIRKKMGHTA